MPDIVKRYIESGIFSDTLDIQEQIRLDYEGDVRKYAEGLDQTKIISVYRSIPLNLQRKTRRFSSIRFHRTPGLENIQVA